MRSRVACLFFESPAPLRELAEACLRFTPQVAIREPEAIFLQIGPCLHLYSEAGLTARVRALCARFQAMPRIAIADRAPEALTQVRYQKVAGTFLPLEALVDFADPFRVPGDPTSAEIEKRIRSWIEKLEALGIRTIGDLERIPARALASRFGADALELIHLGPGGRDPLWPRFILPDRILEREEVTSPETMESCAYALEALLFGLKRVGDRAMARLRARGLRAQAVRLHLATERKGDREWRLELPVPQGSTSGLLPILRERLAFDLEREPLAYGVEAITLEVTETAPGHGAQPDFFDRREAEAEAWDELIGRLASRLGTDHAFLATPENRHLPESAWRPTLQVSEAALAPPAPLALEETAPRRPTRLLKEPERLIRMGAVLIHSRRHRRWRVREWDGPERLSGEWWSDPDRAASDAGFQRDYYRVSTESGEELWVFISPDQRLYLHGYFD